MRLLLRDHFATAWHSLRTNRTRSLLTMTGVAIGVASITTILSLTHGVTQSISQQVEQVDGSLALVRPSQVEDDSPDILRIPLTPQQYNTSTLSEADIDAIRSISSDLKVAPIMAINGTMRAYENTVKDATTVATTPELLDTVGLQLGEGDFHSDQTSDNVAVVGYQLAVDLFGTDMPIGQRFNFREQTFTVIGVLERQKTPLNYSNVDFNNTAIVTLTAGKAFHQGRSQIQQINIAAPSAKQMKTLLPDIKAQLKDSHQGERDYRIVRGDNISTPTSQVYKTLSGVMTAIAAISLVVGGIGIMNIMLVGVAERTREIGLRKAVGASNMTIITQFLIESTLISTVGGIAGYLFGLLLTLFIGAALYLTPTFSVAVAIAAICTSTGVGVLFGLYPALRASRKDPIESLRQYR